MGPVAVGSYHLNHPTFYLQLERDSCHESQLGKGRMKYFEMRYEFKSDFVIDFVHAILWFILYVLTVILVCILDGIGTNNI